MNWNFVRRLAVAGFALALAANVAAAETAKKAATPPAKAATSATAPAAKPGGYPYGYVYLFRGLGNFPSRGIDTFKSELDALGIRTAIDNHTRWQNAADKVIANYKKDKNFGPIIIIGHSFGANAAIVMSRWLGENGVPVRLVVTFDGRFDIQPLGNNVAELIDYYKPSFGRPTPVVANFAGKKTVTNLAGHAEITHNSIDKMPEFHKAVLARILEILKTPPKPAKS